MAKGTGRDEAQGLQTETMISLSQEVESARAKFPSNEHLLAALQEEVGELAEAYLKKKPTSEVRVEALQVACVALRIYEEGDASFDSWQGESAGCDDCNYTGYTKHGPCACQSVYDSSDVSLPLPYCTLCGEEISHCTCPL